MPGSPACSASRMRLEETRSPSSSTGATVSAAMPCCCAELAQHSALPPRPLPKVKSSPVTTPAAPIRFASTSATKSSALVAGQLGVEVEHQHRVGAGMGEQPLALVERGQAERRDVGLEVAHRMRVEGRDDHRPPLVGAALRPPGRPPPGGRGGSRRNCRARRPRREVFGDRLVEGQALHCAGLSALHSGNSALVSDLPDCRSAGQASRGQCEHGMPLDSAPCHSYLRLIPFHRLPAAHSCARRFFVWMRA